MSRPPQLSRAPKPKTFALLLFSALCLAACSPGGQQAGARRFELKGKVLSVDRAKGTAEVEHEEIKNFMAAMTMDFPVRDAEALKVLEAGDGVQATLVFADDGAYWIENLIVTKGRPGATATKTSSGASEPKPGDEIPDVKLVNQDGRPLDTRGLKGRAVVVTFIYTRCPLPDQCPLLSANFARLNAALTSDAELRKRARLLSVTLDPEYDRPEVLKSYGAAYSGGKFDGWDFATGDPAEVRRFAEFFGLIYQAEKDQIVHSLRTAVVTPDGKLYKVYRGNEWKPEEVLSDLRSLPAS